MLSINETRDLFDLLQLLAIIAVPISLYIFSYANNKREKIKLKQQKNIEHWNEFYQLSIDFLYLISKKYYSNNSIKCYKKDIKDKTLSSEFRITISNESKELLESIKENTFKLLLVSSKIDFLRKRCPDKADELKKITTVMDNATNKYDNDSLKIDDIKNISTDIGNVLDNW